MMTISHTDLGAEENLGRRVLVRARFIAPCLDSLEGEDKANAIAILKGVIAEMPAAGTRRTRSLSRNGTSMGFDPVAASFTDEDVSSLQSLCAQASTRTSIGPVGSFPTDRPIGRVWPEGRYS